MADIFFQVRMSRQVSQEAGVVEHKYRAPRRQSEEFGRETESRKQEELWEHHGNSECKRAPKETGLRPKEGCSLSGPMLPTSLQKERAIHVFTVYRTLQHAILHLISQNLAR
jgi:hypothetical protein